MFKSTFLIFTVFSTTLFAAPILDGLGGATGGATGGAADPLSSLPAGDLLGGGGSGGLLSSLNLGNILNTLKATDLIHCDKTLKLLRIQVDIGIPLASKPEDNGSGPVLPPLPTGLPIPLPTGLPVPLPTGLPIPLPSGVPNPLPTGLPIPSGNPIDNLPVPSPSIPGPSNPLGGLFGKK
uniref:Uncharacterized protein n=1 Tax=Panagrolaimus davidi TaxID=227884 RepID=A0A914P8U5_9BILA